MFVHRVRKVRSRSSHFSMLLFAIVALPRRGDGQGDEVGFCI